MMTFLFRHLRGYPAECCGILRTAATTTKGTHVTQESCQHNNNNTHRKYHLRSPYSILHHHYKDLGTIAEARIFVNNFPKLKGVDEAQLDHLLRLIKKDGHCWKEVELFKEALLLTPEEYRQRFQLLQDLSLSSPSLYHVLGLASVMGLTTNTLKKSGNIFDSDPFELLLSAARYDFKLSETTLRAARDLYENDDQVTLRDVYIFLLKHYLSSRFSIETEPVASLLNRSNLPSLVKPLYHYPKICDVIIDCLGFSYSEVQDRPLLLFVDPNNTKEILQRFPNIGGIPTREVVKTHPRLLQIPASHLDSWLTLLDKYQVCHFSYTYHTTIMFKTCSFSEVEKRIQALQGLQEWEVIVASDILFVILRSHKYTKRLLNAAESGRTISSLIPIIRTGKPIGRKQWHGLTSEVVSYVSSTLDLPLDQTKELLMGEVCTPFGISNIKTVLRLLLDYGFTREQVVMGAMVLNFEAGVVEQILRDLHERPEAQPFAEWIENPFVLHLLAYCIKKDIPHLELPSKKVNLETFDFSVPTSNDTDY